MQLLIWRGLLLTSLAISGAIVTDYLSGASAYCGFQGGCDTVMSSAYGRPLGVPLPLVAIVGFGLLFVLGLFPGTRAFRLTGPLSLLAGVCGLTLIIIQAVVLRRICPLCMMIDLLAIGVAAVRFYPVQPVAVPVLTWRRRAGWLALAVVAVAAPPLAVLLKPDPGAPAAVKAYWVDGKITVVEVMDFQCVHCQKTEPVLQAFLREHRDKIHFVRVLAPALQNRAAARAYLAAKAQGKAQEMASLLFQKQRGSAKDCRAAAAYLKLDLKQFDRTMNDPQTDALLDRDLAWVKKVGKGLPLIWVQGYALHGTPTAASLEGAWWRAEHDVKPK